MSTADVIGIIGLIILGLTLAAVCWYAWEARKQAEGTRLAVEATRAMTVETREQRLAEDKPLLILDMTNFTTGGIRPGKDRAIEDCYPETITFRVRNIGSGPAIDVDMTVIHPKVHYWRNETKGYLLRDESIEYDTSVSVYTPNGLGLTGGLRKIGVDASQAHTLGLAVTYRDVHEQSWVAWMALDYDWDIGGENNDEPIWWLNEAAQHTAKFSFGDYHKALFGGGLSTAAPSGEGPDEAG